LAGDESADAPQILPGGHAVLFTLAKGVSADRWEQAQIVVQPLPSGNRTIVVERGSAGRYVSSGHLVYAQGGVLFATLFDRQRLRAVGDPIPIVEGVRRGTAGAGVQGNPLLSGTAHYSISDTGTLIYIPGPLAPMALSNELAWIDRAGKVERLPL